MRQHVKDILTFQVFDQFVEVAPEPLDFTVLICGYPQCQHMQLDVFVGEIGGHFFADEKIIVMRQRQGAFDGVVVGEGNVGHPPFLGPLIGGFRVGVALPDPGLPQNPEV